MANKMIKHIKGCILWQTLSLPQALLVQCFSAFTESALTSSLIVLFGSTNLKKQDEIGSSKWLKGSLDESYIITSKMRADKHFWPLTFCPQHLPAIPCRDEIRDNRHNRNRTVSSSAVDEGSDFPSQIPIKGLVHPKMKIRLLFTHPQAIGVYDFLLSDESNRSYIKNCPGTSKLYHCSKWVFLLHSPKHAK